MEPYANPEGCTTAPCGNYAGAMADCDEAVKQMIRLCNGETTVERTRKWIKANYPKLSKGLEDNGMMIVPNKRN